MSKKTIIITVFVLMILAGALLWLSCRDNPVPIDQVLVNARAYAGKIIPLEGTVTNNISFMGKGAFLLEDESGQITVITAKGTPTVGEKVKIKGEVKQALSVGGFNMIIFVEKDRL